MPATAAPELQTRTETSAGDPAGDWLCAWCHNRVANEKDRFQYEGKDEFTFSNPERIRFEIILFSQTLGCRRTGVPTLEHTWFAGHAWSYCHCDQCRQHLGWFYKGQHQFTGLIRSRIVRAAFVRN
jgi:hypothetical protein